MKRDNRMDKSRVDLPSLFMVLSLTSNLIIGLFDPIKIPTLKEIGIVILVCGSLFFVYVLFYLRSGFFGETEPKLDHLIKKGPYNFCRHPQYLSFIILVFGMDLSFRSVIGIVFTLVLSIPSIVYRARVEDNLLKSKFGKEWENYAKNTGFLFPKIKRQKLLMLVALFVTSGLVMDFIHEVGHALWGTVLGGKLTYMQIAYLEIYPRLAINPVFRLGITGIDGLTFGSFAYGFMLLGGSMTTNLISWLLALILVKKSLSYKTQAALKLLGFFGILDLPFYVVLPQMGLNHWIFMGGRDPEPLLGARMMNIPDLVFYLLVVASTFVLVYIYFKTFKRAN
jgi:protein-S-isoprenylcysteine O-methyltransferase Ste14